MGVGDSIGIYHIATYYLDPHASFRQSVSHTKAHEISGNIAFDIKAIAAELGYGYTNSKTITREVSYTNNTSRQVTVQIYPVYLRTDYDVYLFNKKVGWGWLNVLNSYAVFTD